VGGLYSGNQASATDQSNNHGKTIGWSLGLCRFAAGPAGDRRWYNGVPGPVSLNRSCAEAHSDADYIGIKAVAVLPANASRRCGFLLPKRETRIKPQFIATCVRIGIYGSPVCQFRSTLGATIRTRPEDTR
jgi:hypothetical protein